MAASRQTSRRFRIDTKALGPITLWAKGTLGKDIQTYEVAKAHQTEGQTFIQITGTTQDEIKMNAFIAGWNWCQHLAKTESRLAS